MKSGIRRGLLGSTMSERLFDGRNGSAEAPGTKKKKKAKRRKARKAARKSK